MDNDQNKQSAVKKGVGAIKDKIPGQAEATELIRKRISALFNKQDGEPEQHSLIEKFWHQHYDHPDKEHAWGKYYESLSDEEKKKLWEEYQKQWGNLADDTHTHAATAAAATAVQQQAEAPQAPQSQAQQTQSSPDPATTQQPPLTQEPAQQTTAQTNTQAQTQSPENQVQSATGQTPAMSSPHEPIHTTDSNVQPKPGKKQSVADLKEQLVTRTKSRSPANDLPAHHKFKPLIAGISVALLVFAINYNEFAIAQIKQYVSPGDTLASPVILDPNASIDIGEEPKIIIPKINVDVPVVYDITSYEEDEIQAGLERGVVHYGDTALPGEAGNNVIVGHSSNNFFNDGKYKFAFVLLDRLEIGDTFILHYEGTRYIYKVYNKQVIEPDDFSLIQPTATPTTTLITCTPPGTSWQRLVIQGEQITPEPGSEQLEAPEQPISTGTETEVVPGNSPSLWSRFVDWIWIFN